VQKAASLKTPLLVTDDPGLPIRVSRASSPSEGYRCVRMVSLTTSATCRSSCVDVGTRCAFTVVDDALTGFEAKTLQTTVQSVTVEETGW
jgi:hypothetical protein